MKLNRQLNGRKFDETKQYITVRLVGCDGRKELLELEYEFSPLANCGNLGKSPNFAQLHCHCTREDDNI